MTLASDTLENAPVLRQDAAGVATLTLNRPQQYNTLSMSMLTALSAALAEVAADDSVRVVVLASTGKAYCTGHDLKELRARPEEAFYQEVLSTCSRLMQTIVALPQPVIASVQGIATAAGCQLVASCDLALAAESARFATSGINYGLFCSTPAVALSRVVPRKAALEMLYTGEFIDAATAERLGLINHAVKDTELPAAVGALAARIAAQSTYAIRLGKVSFNQQAGQPLDAAYRCASADLVRNLLAADGVEGLQAFFEKRTPVFNR